MHHYAAFQTDMVHSYDWNTEPGMAVSMAMFMQPVVSMAALHNPDTKVATQTGRIELRCHNVAKLCCAVTSHPTSAMQTSRQSAHLRKLWVT